MEIVLGFDQLLQALAPTMTVPTFQSLVTILTGWVFAPRRTVTRMMVGADNANEKHYSSYHRLFSAARWSLDAIGLAVFELMSPWLDEIVLIGIDDTLARKRSRKVFGVTTHCCRAVPKRLPT
jgi:DDE superfamily endonuclease